jgi:glycosyltransferase involved in cell wall biosynthesis
MTPLKFCMVTTFYPPFSFGGDGVFVHRLAQALAAQGHQVDVIHSADAYRTLGGGEPQHAFDEHPNVTRHALRTRWPKGAALTAHQLGSPSVYGSRLKTLLREGQYDVVHYHNISLMGGPGVLRFGDGLKLYTTHEYWLICPTHVLFKFDREACQDRQCLQCTLRAGRPPQLWRLGNKLADCIKHVDQFLVPSQFALARHRADGISAPMRVLPNFVPLPTDSLDTSRLNERPFFLCVGRLERLKGVQDMIKLFRSYRDADLLIIGDGGYRADLERLAGGLDHVRFLGAMHPSKLSDYYRQAVAVLVPSLCFEVFPLIPAEAMAHGTPVIARHIGALAEVVEESGGGITFRSLDECGQAIRRLQDDGALRQRLGTQGREKVLADWTTEAHLDQYFAVIEELLQR